MHNRFSLPRDGARPAPKLGVLDNIRFEIRFVFIIDDPSFALRL